MPGRQNLEVFLDSERIPKEFIAEGPGVNS